MLPFYFSLKAVTSGMLSIRSASGPYNKLVKYHYLDLFLSTHNWNDFRWNSNKLWTVLEEQVFYLVAGLCHQHSEAFKEENTWKMSGICTSKSNKE